MGPFEPLQPLKPGTGSSGSEQPSCCCPDPGQSKIGPWGDMHKTCCGDDEADTCCGSGQDEVCCGKPPSPPSSSRERPGYAIQGFVDRFLETPSGPVPVVASSWGVKDYAGTLGARCGFHRDDYKVAPGLYALGNPGPEAPVLVTANYKLSFDVVRRDAAGMDAWLLVIDTRGINVWCAAGKTLFATSELVRRVKMVGLDRVVSHRRLVLPQLGATGVSAREVKKGCGFEVIWGPVRSSDLNEFVSAGMQADRDMRTVTFTLKERFELIPVEIYSLKKQLLWALLGVVLISGIGPGLFSLTAALERGAMAFTALLAGILTGTTLTPILLPWMPGRAFALKGTWAGLMAGLVLALLFRGRISGLETASVILAATAVSSYLAMNFTGSSPYTSATGVEKEMKLAMPFQALAALIAVGCWVVGGFAG